MDSIKKYENGLAWAVIILYAAALVVVGIYHEPWFDEAQAWQIAKCASVYDILFSIPHVEGHPPLWHLILAIPARLGADYEVSLKMIGFLFSVASVSLIELKSPFPVWVKVVLPFSYFIFYQYGIIVRPYSMMLLAFILTAMSFQQRNEKPGRFVLALLFLCLTMAYGIVFAGGIAACWLFDIIREKRAGISELAKDRRILFLSALLAAALVIITLILPNPGTVALSGDEEQNPRWLCIVCVLMTSLSSCFLLSTGWSSRDRVKLRTAELTWDSFFPAVICDFILWTLIISCASRKNLKYLVIPYVLFAAFSGAVYVAGHHIGVVLLFLIFWFWIDFKDENQFEIGRLLIQKLHFSENDIHLVKKLGVCTCVLCAVIPFVWSVRSVGKDIRKNYSYGREIAAFIREKQLEGLKIACYWGEEPGAVDVNGKIDYSKIETVYTGVPVPIVAYFDRNLFYTLNHGKDDKAYCINQVTDEITNRKNMELWRTEGVPDILIGPVRVNLLTNNKYTINEDYTPVFRCDWGGIWKGYEKENTAWLLYARNDLVEKYGFQKVELPEGLNNDISFGISDKVKEAYAKGEDYRSLLDAQFNYVFGLEEK